MKSAVGQLEYRAHPADATACACCGSELADRDGYCSECQTPADLSRAVAARETPPRFLSVLGASGAGKTVFLGLLLDILNRGTCKLRGLATNAFSVALQEQVVTALERRCFPEKTPAEADGWQWVHCEVTLAEPEKPVQKRLDLVAPDFAGEAIAMEIAQSGLYPAIRDVVAKSDGVLILCDSMKVRDAGPGEDLFAMKLASYIAQLQGQDAQGRRQPPGAAIAVVFTKCDGCPEAREDAAGFAANNMPRLVEFCQRAFARHAFFSASVVGSAGTIRDSTGRSVQIPFHVEPYGVHDPLEWIMSCS